jgi:5'-nucleotidase
VVTHLRSLALTAFAAVVVTVAPAASGAGTDGAQQQRTVDVQILALNETHGQLVPLNREGRPAGGAGALAAYLQREESENRRTLILDSGDFMQGPPISSFFQGESAVEVFNEMGVDAVAVGNHEFDWGRETLAARQKQSQFPFLAVNIVEERTGKPPEGIKPFLVRKLCGVRVGVIGVANPDTKSVTLPTATEGLEFLDRARTAQAVNAAVAELRAREVETIVVAAHQGLTTPTEGDLADLVTRLSQEIDLVVAGHIPLEFSTTINGIPVVQPFGNTRGYADVTLTVDPRTRDVVDVEATLDPTWVDEITPDAEVQTIVDRYQAVIDEALGKTVGEAVTSVARDRNAESEMGNFVADAMRGHVAGVDFALTNAGGLRADIDAGPITLGEVYAVLPFNNTLVTMDLTGDQVRRALEEGYRPDRYGVVQVSGLRWTVDPDAPAGSRVTAVTLPDGTPLDAAATYRVATNNFMAAGGDEFTTLTQGANTVDTGVDVVDTVVGYLERSSPVDPQVEGRLTVV